MIEVKVTAFQRMDLAGYFQYVALIEIDGVKFNRWRFFDSSATEEEMDAAFYEDLK